MPEICAYCNRRIRPGKGKTLKGDRICEGCLKLEPAHRTGGNDW